ncbi:hypothetical protein SAMN05660226_00940 [Parapedobacter luteus]|uniref:Uncharacterized protein n=1 Tax=Parapedobacter luteus TaxID=623280 RepID=A0A1T5APG5_9SPHI|nr:hypothetical protein SAMN05660226_00940 [Parapedobacter luteus]
MILLKTGYSSAHNKSVLLHLPQVILRSFRITDYFSKFEIKNTASWHG